MNQRPRESSMTAAAVDGIVSAVSCISCQYARGRTTPLGGVVNMDAWALTHYAGPEGYLGWLAAFPQRHVTTWSDLRSSELGKVGALVRMAEAGLRRYFHRVHADPLERVYLVYFYESAFEPDCAYHMHCHLIPRTQTMPLEGRGWGAPRAATLPAFPPRYAPSSDTWTSDVAAVMHAVRGGRR